MSQEQFPADPSRYPERSSATTVLVLGLLGLVFSILAPFAWVMGNRELEAIDQGRRPPENRQTANVGRILGIVGTVLMILALLFVLFVFGVLLPGLNLRMFHPNTGSTT